MLKFELLKDQEALKGLSDDQLKLIEQLSANDEKIVIGTKIGEVHRQYDDDIFSVMGVRKKPGEHTYTFLKDQILPDLKDKAAKYEDVLSEKEKLEDKIGELEKKIKEGSTDGALKERYSTLEQRYNDEKARTDQLKKELEDRKTELEKSQQEFGKKLTQQNLEVIFAQELAKVTPIEGISQEAFEELVKARTEKFLATTEVEAVKGTEGNTFTFRRDGAQLNNRENALNPYTPQEIYRTEILKGIVSDNQKGAGGGGKGGAAGGGGVISGTWRTQVEATESIRQGLADKGIGIEHADYDAQFQKAWEDNNVKELPLSE